MEEGGSPPPEHGKQIAGRGNLPRGAACLGCRKKRVRCDGGRPSCETCRNRKEECVYESQPKNIHTAMFQRMIDIEGKNINFDLQIARQGKMIADLTEKLTKRKTLPPSPPPFASPPPMIAFAGSRSYRHINSLHFDPSKSNYKFIRKLGGSGTKGPRGPYPSNGMPSQRSASSPSTSCPNIEFSTPSADMTYSDTPHILETQFLVNPQQQPRKVSFSPRIPRSRPSRPRAHTSASARSRGYPDPGVQHTHRSISYHGPPQDSPISQECLPLSPGHRSQSQPQQIYHYQDQNESIPQPSFLAPSFEHLLYDNTMTPSLLSQSPFASLSALPHSELSGGIPSTAICGSLPESQGYQADQEIRYSNSSPVDGFVELFKRYEAEDNFQNPLMQPQQPVQPAPTVPEPYTGGQLQYHEHGPPAPFHESQLERQFHPPPQVVAEDQYQAPSSLSYHPQVLSQPVLAPQDPNVPQQQQHFSSLQQDQNTSYDTHYDQNDSSTFLCHIPEIPLPGTQIGVTSSTSKSWHFDGVPPFPLTPHLFAESAQEGSLTPYAPHRVKNASFPLPEGLWDDITDEPKPELKDFLITLFLIHRRQCSLELHSSRFFERLKSENSKDKPHPALVHAMYMLACWFTRPFLLSVQEEKFFQRSHAHLPLLLTEQPPSLLEYVQASVLSALYFYGKGRMLEGYQQTCSAGRMAMLCGLHKIESPIWRDVRGRATTFGKHVQSWKTNIRFAPFLLDPPKDATELGERIHAFWSCWILDASGCATHGMPLLFKEDVEESTPTTPLPLPIHFYSNGLASDHTACTLAQFWAREGKNDSRIPDHPMTLRIKSTAVLERASRLGCIQGINASYGFGEFTRLPEDPSKDQEFRKQWTHVRSTAFNLFNATPPIRNPSGLGAEIVDAWRIAGIDPVVVHAYNLCLCAIIYLGNIVAEHTDVATEESLWAADRIFDAAAEIQGLDFIHLDIMLGVCWMTAVHVYIRRLKVLPSHEQVGREMMKNKVTLLLFVLGRLGEVYSLVEIQADKAKADYSDVLKDLPG